MTRKRREEAVRFVGRPPGPKPGDLVTIHGLPCRVVTPKQAERSTVVVCALLTIPLYFADNLTGPCEGGCNRTLQWRPHAPKKPPKMCMECSMLRFSGTAGTA